MLGMVVIPRRAFRTDGRRVGVVVVRRGWAGEPLEPVAVPWVGTGRYRLAPRHHQVDEEEQERESDDVGTEGRDHVQGCPAGIRRIAGDTPGHTVEAHEVLGHERHPEAY